MPYNRPIKTIASIGGSFANRYVLKEVISSDVIPTEKSNGDALIEGDYWYDTTNSNLYLFIVDQFVLVGGPGTTAGQQSQIDSLSILINANTESLLANTEVDESQGLMINNNTSSIGDLGQQINDIKGRLDALEAPENIE